MAQLKSWDAGTVRQNGDRGERIAIAVILLLAAAILTYGRSKLNKSMAASSWPVTSGFIQACKVETRHVSAGEGGDYEEYRAQVKYWYGLEGRKFEREYFAYAYDVDDSFEASEKLCAQLRSAKSVDVRYDPNHPTEAFLAWGPSRNIILIFYLGGWLLLICCRQTLAQFHWRNGLLEDFRLDLLKGGKLAAWIMFFGIWVFGWFVQPYYFSGLVIH